MIFNTKLFNLCLAFFIFGTACSQKNTKKEEPDKTMTAQENISDDKGVQTITLGAGCFWCVEAIFDELKGVQSVTSGYSGGVIDKPTYEEVCTGTTGHAEVCQVTYDADVIPTKDLLEVFFKTHDPTTLNRQGADVGTQYRSAIFYHNEKQKEIAEDVIQKLKVSGAYDMPIVTEVTKYSNFFKAEDYHQQYFELNGHQPYCRAVVQPKVEKFKKAFKDKLKD